MSLTCRQFSRLVEEHAPALFRMAFRMLGDQHEAEDMVQEAFRSAWTSRHRFQAGRGDRAWLAAILRRRMIDRLRKRAVANALQDTKKMEPLTFDSDPFDKEYSDEVQAGLNQLSADLRETLLLVVVAELTHREVAEMLNVPLGTVLSRVSRARKQLRRFLIAQSRTSAALFAPFRP